MPQTAPSRESSVRLPRAVRAQVERINALAESIAPETPAPIAEPAAPAAPAAEAAPSASTPPAAPVAAPTAPPASPADPRATDPSYWEQRFRVTQGMLEKERRERNADRDRFDEQLSELRQQLSEAQRTQAPSSAPAIDVTQFFTPEQIEQYGEEQCRTIAAVAVKASAEQARTAVEAELKPIREQHKAQNERTQKDRVNTFWDKLADEVPDYEEVNATDGWKLWLAEEDPATGMQRQELLSMHQQGLRADRIALMFKAYKATQATPPVSPSGRAGPPAAPQAPNAPAGGYPSPAEIRDYYKRAAIGKVSDRERSEFEARLQLPRRAA